MVDHYRLITCLWEGRPYNRGLDYGHWVAQQASHDETFPILDCRQRLAGYTFVLGHDMDEMAIPARHIDLKTFFKEQLQVSTPVWA